MEKSLSLTDAINVAKERGIRISRNTLVKWCHPISEGGFGIGYKMAPQDGRYLFKGFKWYIKESIFIDFLEGRGSIE